MGVRLPLKVVTTRSTVAELPSGDSPDLSEYAKTSWVEANYTTQNDFYTNVGYLGNYINQTADKLNNEIDNQIGNVKSELTSVAMNAELAIDMASSLNRNAFTLSGTYEDGTKFSFKAAGIPV